jgi:hypothetical protein
LEVEVKSALGVVFEVLPKQQGRVVFEVLPKQRVRVVFEVLPKQQGRGRIIPLGSIELFAPFW